MTGLRMCFRLWTAHFLNFVNIIALLSIGSCLGRVTVIPETSSSGAAAQLPVNRDSPLIFSNFGLTTSEITKPHTQTTSQVTSSELSFGTSTSAEKSNLIEVATSTTTNVPLSSSALTPLDTGSDATLSLTSTTSLSSTKPGAKIDKYSITPTSYNLLSSNKDKVELLRLTDPKADPKERPMSYTSTLRPVIPHSPARLEERPVALDCDLPLLPNESRLWRGNETHELNLPITMPEDCVGAATSTAGMLDDDCPPVILSWEGSADIQSGDILIVRVDDTRLVERAKLSGETRNLRNAGVDIVNTGGQTDRMHRSPPQPAVYQVTRQGHEHCDVTEGVLLDITPLAERGSKLVTLYDKDLTEGVNLLIVVSESWGSQCVRLKVTVKSDNCGDGQDCSGKGVCYSNVSMEGYECQCCPGYMGPHCEEQDACNPPPCLNQGICVDISQGHDGALFQCLCPYGFTGKTCSEKVDPCSTAPCQNGGRCRRAISAVSNESSWQCDCPAGWAGERCERAAGGGACAGDPCVHGICVEQDANEARLDGEGYRCFCQPGFAGVRCEYEYNECESSPCANGGTCTDRVGAFVCACGRGYTGRTCQIKVDLCSPSPCTSRRYCIDRGNSYACECPRGFTGIDCLLPAKAACDNNPCAHGGTCWSGVDSFYCACRPGYTGKLCQDNFILESVLIGGGDSASDAGGGASVREVRLPMALYHDRLHNVYIAAGTLGAAIAIVGVVVTACHCRVNKTYARFLSRVYHSTDPGPTPHWLQDKRVAPLHAPHSTPLPGPHPAPLRAPLDTADMYYTLDFSDSQSSPLIQ